MNIDSNQHALRIAMDLFKARQPLAAALVYAEIARSGLSAPDLWCGLGASLMASRGQLVRRPFEVWATKVFRRGEPTFAKTPYADVVKDWLPELPDFTKTPPLSDAELTPMIEFLLVNEAVLPDAAMALSPDMVMGVVMALGDRGDPLYVPLLRAAVEGRLGDGAARSALKRIGPFLERPDMQASLLAVSQSPMREELEPYLGSVLQRLPAGWDAARTSACPPYEGIGKIDVELISAGSDPAAAASVLRLKLGAAERDAKSWLEHTPCMIKKGAMRDDALRLSSELQALGAKVKMHKFKWRTEDTPPVGGAAAEPAEAEEVEEKAKGKKPWWKFW